MLDSQAFAEEWEAFCREDYEKFKADNAPPCLANFWSGGAFFNSFERWSDRRRAHYMRVGEAWWNERGFTVTSWPRSSTLPITVEPLKTNT